MPTRVSLERWREVDELFAHALEYPRELRGSFLAEACGGDRALFDTVSSLVAASESAEQEFEAPAEALLRQAFSGPPDDRTAATTLAPGDTIGRYRLIRVIGHGGMATVFEAERVHGTYEQRVAVKLLRSGVDGAEIARRFQVEAQILSRLVHPNIARLLDAGTTNDGQPYLVMELVDGEPITNWADRHRLDVDARLDLFAQVSDAVGFAHTHLIVHRDLKPANVLVGHDGQVKLLDFGIAKLLEPDGSAPMETRPTTRWMTPGYASPEQILGRPVTTATDVHGLGLLLYELLAGRRPFDDGTLLGFDLDLAICEQSPTRLSAAVSASPSIADARGTVPDRLRRRLAGDLDAIVAKSLRKPPEERYASVRGMAKDIERHRTGFPVEAREGLRAYGARKFVSRHRVGVIATAAIATILIGSSLTLWRQQLATAEARDQAATQAENAGLVIDFLADVFRGRNPEQGPSDTLTARELLAWGSERVDTEFADRPALRVALLDVLGNAYKNVGLIDEAVTHHARSVDVSRSVYGNRSPEVANRLIALSDAHRTNRSSAQAVPAAQEALTIRRATVPAGDTAIASALVELARARIEHNEPDSAESLLREAIGIYRAHAGRDDRRHASALTDLAQVRRMQGEPEHAARLYEEAIPLLRASGDPDFSTQLNNHAYLLRTLGDYARAEMLYREALEIITRLHGRGHPRASNVRNNLASVLHEQGKSEDVVAVLREGVAAASVQWPGGHWRVGAQHAALGRALLRYRRFDDAFVHLRQAREIYGRLLGERHLWTHYLEATLAAGYIASGQPGQSRQYLDDFYRHRVDERRAIASPAAEQAFLNLMQPFVYVLRDLELNAEAERFGALVQTSDPASGGSR
jgi:eukaryotic-like serine/threonine-protein kinase